MKPASDKPDLDDIGASAFREVLTVLCPGSVASRDPAVADPSFPACEGMAGSVVLTGEQVSGRVEVHVPRPFVMAVFRQLTGIGDGGEGHDALLDDATGELANMVAGRIAARLGADGYPCTLGTPSISRGVPPPSTVQAEADCGRADLSCDGHTVSLALRCRFGQL
jgi:CheY-specific phosphatase CheX